MNTVRPFLLGIINAILPGLGYIWIDGRRIFGWMVLSATLASIVARHGGFPTGQLLSQNKIAVAFELISIILLPIAFGFDAYAQAKIRR